MRSTISISILTLSLGLAGAALADPTPAAPAAAPAKKAPSPDEVICTQEPVTGSIFPKRVCLTRAQRAKLEDENHGVTMTSHGDDRTVRSETP